MEEIVNKIVENNTYFYTVIVVSVIVVSTLISREFKGFSDKNKRKW